VIDSLFFFAATYSTAVYWIQLTLIHAVLGAIGYLLFRYAPRVVSFLRLPEPNVLTIRFIALLLWALVLFVDYVETRNAAR
jgi:hypothetical protein